MSTRISGGATPTVTSEPYARSVNGMDQIAVALGMLGAVRLRLEAGKGASEETKLIIIALAALAILAALILPAIGKGAGKAADEIAGP